MNKTMKLSGPDHPITITPESRRVMVTLGGTIIADSTERYPCGKQAIRQSCTSLATTFAWISSSALSMQRIALTKGTVLITAFQQVESVA